MKIQPFISHTDLLAEIPEAKIPFSTLDDELVEWFRGAGHTWITADENKSYDFRKLPGVIKNFIIEKVNSNELPEHFAIFYDN